MPESGTSGSVGAGGGRPPSATRPVPARPSGAHNRPKPPANRHGRPQGSPLRFDPITVRVRLNLWTINSLFFNGLRICSMEERSPRPGQNELMACAYSPTQFSTTRPGTRSNSLVLAVTTVKRVISHGLRSSRRRDRSAPPSGPVRHGFGPCGLRRRDHTQAVQTCGERLDVAQIAVWLAGLLGPVHQLHQRNRGDADAPLLQREHPPHFLRPVANGVDHHIISSLGNGQRPPVESPPRLQPDDPGLWCPPARS